MDESTNYEIIPLEETRTRGEYMTPSGETVKAQTLFNGLCLFELHEEDLENICALSICHFIKDALRTRNALPISLHPDFKERFGFIEQPKKETNVSGEDRCYFRAVQLYEILKE